jgi:hypothetical protein
MNMSRRLDIALFPPAADSDQLLVLVLVRHGFLQSGAPRASGRSHFLSTRGGIQRGLLGSDGLALAACEHGDDEEQIHMGAEATEGAMDRDVATVACGRPTLNGGDPPLAPL